MLLIDAFVPQSPPVVQQTRKLTRPELLRVKKVLDPVLSGEDQRGLYSPELWRKIFEACFGESPNSQEDTRWDTLYPCVMAYINDVQRRLGGA